MGQRRPSTLSVAEQVSLHVGRRRRQQLDHLKHGGERRRYISVLVLAQGSTKTRRTFSLQRYQLVSRSSLYLDTIEALGQCIPPPRHVLPVLGSGSGSVIQIATEIYFVHSPIVNLPWKFHANPFRRFCTKMLTDKQTDRQTDSDENTSFRLSLYGQT